MYKSERGAALDSQLTRRRPLYYQARKIKIQSAYRQSVAQMQIRLIIMIYILSFFITTTTSSLFAPNVK